MAHYYDVDEIIVEEELVSAVFQKAANGVGILDPSAETNSVNSKALLCFGVEQGSKVELPFWLAHELLQRQAVTINVPACFNQKTRKEIQADAPCVDLRSRCPYFYELGCKVAPL
ncbi:DNA replication complex GINS protein PSF3 [Vitis vinifera]|uniref:DNA replication complex GINS protein PSF3 n=1 Tax=Vitis vinifera TaxID=29760 RepID=A0A438J2D5_VITVI|nr:DNA replication complex GINS protein PSF3 [Vitis vinifera]